MKAKNPGRSDRTSMTFPTGVWRCYSTWCRSNGWYPSHRITVFLEKELERAGIDWRADSSFADVEVGAVKKAAKPETRTEYSWGNYIPSGETVETVGPVAPEPVTATDSPVEAVEPEVMEPEDDEFASINKMFKL